MKTKLHLFTTRIILWAAVVGLVLSTTLQAATNAPSAEVIQSNSSIFKGKLYSIRFPGGTISEFFKFMRTNGFAQDTILFAPEANEVYIPEFTVSNVRLSEVAKSIEFLAENRIVVELVEAPLAGDVNIWRIKLNNRVVSEMKTRACAIPHLLTGAKPQARVREILEKVLEALFEGAAGLYHNDSMRPEGNVTIIDSEKIVVVVGTEAYVEAVVNALEAAEKVAASGPAEIKQTQ